LQRSHQINVNVGEATLWDGDGQGLKSDMANGVCKFHNYYANRAHKCIAPCTFSEN
jgi:hypothetical protein